MLECVLPTAVELGELCSFTTFHMYQCYCCHLLFLLMTQLIQMLEERIGILFLICTWENTFKYCLHVFFMFMCAHSPAHSHEALLFFLDSHLDSQCSKVVI